MASRTFLGNTILPTSSTCTVVFIRHTLPIGNRLANITSQNHAALLCSKLKLGKQLSEKLKLGKQKAEITQSKAETLTC
jgi:hypothetical protein